MQGTDSAGMRAVVDPFEGLARRLDSALRKTGASRRGEICQIQVRDVAEIASE